MITLEQVQELDAKIKQAVSLISTLREENAQLRSTLSNYENKVTDLESMVLSLEDGQTKIELGLIDAISKLDNLDIVDITKTEGASEELSPSEETEIVDLENSHENDHSEQAENTTEDFLATKEEHSDKVEEKIVIEEIIETDVEIVSENQDTEVIDESLDNTNDIQLESSIQDSKENVDETIIEDTEEVLEPVVEKKKNNDYSIPMLEIF